MLGDQVASWEIGVTCCIPFKSGVAHLIETMPPIYRCPACGREYTVDEYVEDRFCRDCDTFLRRGQGEKKKKKEGTGWRSLFPYAPYHQQMDFMEDVEAVAEKGGILMAEACNGFGKTASSLASLLPLDRPIIYATRTHEQVRQVLEEVSTINEASGERFTAVNLASRSHLCINPDCSDLPRGDAMEHCRNLRESKECPWEHEIDAPPRGMPPVMTQKILISTGRRKGLCPYYLARRAASGSRIVVVPYPYVFDGKVRAGVGLEIPGKILVLDEGHNLDKVGQETMSDTLSEFVLDMAGEELKSVKAPTSHIRRLARLLRRKTGDRPTLQPADSLQSDLELALGGELEPIIEGYYEHVKNIRANKQKLGDPPSSYLNGVLTFLSLVHGSDKSKYVALYHRNRRGDDVLDYRCLDPSLAVKPIVEAAAGTLIMSGTMTPLDLFAEVLGLEAAEKKAYPAIQDPKNIRMYVDPLVTTTYRERTPEMTLDIGRRIAVELTRIKSGALIFFPQRGLMDRSLDAWGAEGLIETRKGILYLGGKRLFVEGKTAVSNRELVARYKRSAVSPGGAVLCAVFRGRNSEGSNFPGEQARGIILVGVPYANYGDPLVKAQIGYYNKQGDRLGQRWYTMDAFRAANQALGRGIRGVDDWCHYWLLDRRYVNNISLISPWALGSGPEIIEE
jgi:Rad3-related DNA helicase